MIEVAQRNCAMLTTLTEQLLDLSRLEYGKLKLRVEKLDVVQLVKQILGLFDSLIHTRRLSLLFDTNMPELEVYADRDKLEKVIGNLLSNAAKFTAEGGQVTVTLEGASRVTNYTDSIYLPLGREHLTEHELVESIEPNNIASMPEVIRPRALHISQATLRRRIHDLKGITPAQLIRDERLNEARKLFRQNKHYTIAQVANRVGFNNAGYFSRLYVKTFASTPQQDKLLGR